MTDIATTEPAELTIGDTWSWTKSLADYAAPAWTLRYYLRGKAGEIDIVATASGSDHLVSVAKATTAAYKAGLYRWTAVLDDGTTRKTLMPDGLITLKPDPAKIGAGFDPRTHARKALEAIEATIEGRATSQQLDLVSVTIGSRAKQRDVTTLMPWHDRYKAIVANEEDAAKVAAGLGNPRHIYTRLDRV